MCCSRSYIDSISHDENHAHHDASDGEVGDGGDNKEVITIGQIAVTTALQRDTGNADKPASSIRTSTSIRASRAMTSLGTGGFCSSPSTVRTYVIVYRTAQ
jgi:hypothetical protein